MDIANIVTPEYVIVFALIQSVLLLLLIRFLDPYEREPLSLLALLFVWGAVFATTIALPAILALLELLNYASPQVATIFGGAITGPLVEEPAKGIALVIVFALARPIARRFGVRIFDGVANGIVYGAAVGLGFSFIEDLHYLFATAAAQGLEQGMAAYLSRVYLETPIVGQLLHAMYTGTFGAGLGLAVWSRSWIAKIFFPLLGLTAAMFIHLVRNGLDMAVLALRFGLDTTADAILALSAETSVNASLTDLPGEMGTTAAVSSLLTQLFNYVFAALLLLVIVLWIRYQRRVIREELAEEANTGLIDREEEENAPRYWYRIQLYWQVLRSGEVAQWRALRWLYDELVDLALLKRRLKRTGGDWSQVERLRRRIKGIKTLEVQEVLR